MRVLHLLKTAVGARWALCQTRELVKLGVDVHVALPEGPLVDAYRSAGVSVHLAQLDLPVSRPWAFPRVAGDLRRLVDRVRPDIIHSHFVGTTLTMRLALGRRHATPRVFQVPGPLHLEHTPYRQLDLFSAGRQDYWIGSCRWTRDRYGRAGVEPGRRFLSYYGTDVEHMQATGVPGALRAELSLRPATKVVGMVAYMYAPKRWLGQWRGVKGHEDLIDAVALCVSRGLDVVCVMAGGAWNGAIAYERQVRAYGRRKLGDRAIFLGTRGDVARIYPDIDVAVHPSLSENVGGAAESLLMGRPTIATHVGGVPDVISHGETGWLVPPRDPARLATAIADALASPEGARRMAAAGQARARQLLDVRENAREIRQIYEAILSSSAAGPRGDERYWRMRTFCGAASPERLAGSSARANDSSHASMRVRPTVSIGS